MSTDVTNKSWLQQPLNWKAELNRLDQHDAELRLWLPEPCKQVLTALADHQHNTLAQYLRQFTVSYLFGRPTLLWMKQQQLGLFYVEPKPIELKEHVMEAPTMFRRGPTRAEAVKQMGKALSPVKLFLAPFLKSELENAAEHAEVTLGRFLREVLYSHCFGHRELPERFRQWSSSEELIASEWESGSNDHVVFFDANKIDRKSTLVEVTR